VTSLSKKKSKKRVGGRLHERKARGQSVAENGEREERRGAGKRIAEGGGRYSPSKRRSRARERKVPAQKELCGTPAYLSAKKSRGRGGFEEPT